MITFFKKLFKRPAPSMNEYVMAMAEMANESERTYRGMLETYNSDVEMGLLSMPADASPVEPSACGLYKGRLLGSLFMVMAYARSGATEEKAFEMMNLATGVALEPLQSQRGVYLERAEAKSFALEYVTSVFKSMVEAFKAGPGMPGTPTPELIALANHFHDALSESIGSGRYTREVRDRFDVLIQNNIVSAMNHAKRWIT